MNNVLPNIIEKQIDKHKRALTRLVLNTSSAAKKQGKETHSKCQEKCWCHVF
jgi:hypothetical protein